MSELSKERLGQIMAHPPRRARIRPLIPAVAWVLMAGCAVGPDFKRPAAPAVSNYTGHPLQDTVNSTNVVGGEAQHFA